MPSLSQLMRATLITFALTQPAMAAEPVTCAAAGPQSPRDISDLVGNNTPDMSFAPPATKMNLCNIHTHTNAEHKGPGFSILVSESLFSLGRNGGYACDDTMNLTGNQMRKDRDIDYIVKPGKTIEVHWVYTTCDTAAAAPGDGLGACLACDTPQVRVETQVFLVVNDPDALDFAAFTHDGHMVDGHPQPRALPDNTGEPVQFWGSTTDPSFDNDQQCSPHVVTWSVRPDCARISAQSVNAWYSVNPNGTRADGSMNVFNESNSREVRQLVVNPDYLSKIDG